MLRKTKVWIIAPKWMEENPQFFRGGCDIDYKWQVPGAEFWLKKNGY